MHALHTHTIVVLAWLALAGPALADSPPTSVRYIDVSGVGSASAVPDAATFSATVSVQNLLAATAVKEANSRVAALSAALRKAGLTSEHLRTGQFTVQPQFDRKRGEAPRLNGYQVSHSLAVRVPIVNDLGQLLDIALQAGANQIQSVQFVVTDTAEVTKKARAAAYADARYKAEQLAKLSGAHLGAVVFIDESGHAGRSAPRAMAFAARDGASIPIEAGVQAHSISLSVRFKIR